MIDAATRLHDGLYPSQSPTPALKMCGCKEPRRQCSDLAIYHRGQCTVPRFLPRGIVTDCPSRVYDWKPAQQAQTSRKGAKAPSVRDGTSADISRWMTRTLKKIALRGDLRVRAYARSLLLDSDYTTTIETVQMLGETMLQRLEREKPWVTLT